MEFNFVVDRVVRGKIYPALALHQAEPYTPEWRTFGQHMPFTTPLRIQEYCELHEVKINTYSIHDNYPKESYYPICIGFFDFDIDYFKLLPVDVYRAVIDSQIQMLFLYHEGDNPQRIKNRLDELVRLHGLATDCYVFVSSNSAADKLENFVAFQDSELWYYQRNHNHPPLKIHNEKREREFTCLNRTHKWWRAATMADMKNKGILDNAYWSYCETSESNNIDDCPIQIDLIPQLRYLTTKFMQGAPYFSDELSQDARNDHSHLESKYFTNAYCNIVLESQFDYDQSSGVLLSEKTFKPLKHGQLFFIIGAAGSLQQLRKLGYKVFDNIFDNRYDLISDHTQRWLALCESIKKAQDQGIADLFEQARSDIEYNQHLFMQRKHERLNILLEQINDKHR